MRNIIDIIKLYLRTECAKGKLLRKAAEVFLPVLIMYGLHVLTNYQLTLRNIFFYTYLRAFLSVPQVVMRTTSKNISGIFENLACTSLRWKDIIFIETIVAYMKEIGSIIVFNLSVWVAYLLFGVHDVPVGSILLCGIFSMVIPLLLSLLVFAASVMRGLQYTTTGSLPVIGVLSSLVIILSDSILLNAIILGGTSLYIFGGVIYKLRRWTFVNYE